LRLLLLYHIRLRLLLLVEMYRLRLHRLWLHRLWLHLHRLHRHGLPAVAAASLRLDAGSRVMQKHLLERGLRQ